MQKQIVGEIRPRIRPIPDADGKGALAGGGTLLHGAGKRRLIELVAAGGHGDTQVAEHLLVVVHLIRVFLDRQDPDADLACGSRTVEVLSRPRFLVGPIDAVREVGRVSGRDELGHVIVVIVHVGSALAGRECGAQGENHLLLFVEGDLDRHAWVRRLVTPRGVEQDLLVIGRRGKMAPPGDGDGRRGDGRGDRSQRRQRHGDHSTAQACPDRPSAAIAHTAPGPDPLLPIEPDASWPCHHPDPPRTRTIR